MTKSRNSLQQNEIEPTQSDLEAFVSYWKGARKRFSPVYGPRVDRYVAWLVAEGLELGAESLTLWLKEQARAGASASYQCGYFYACKPALQAWAREKCKEMTETEAALVGWRLDKDLDAIRLPKVMKGKRAKMIQELKDSDIDLVVRGATPRISGYISFLVYTGCRVSEMCDLRLDKIRPFDKEKYYATIVGKGDKERAVWISDWLLARLRKIYHGKVLLFETQSGRRVDPDNVYREIKRTFQRVAGILLTPHNLRHYFATKQIRAGASIRAVGSYLGHSDPATTMNSYDVSQLMASSLDVEHSGEKRKRKT